VASKAQGKHGDGLNTEPATRFARRRQRGHRVHVSYQLCALAGHYEVVARAADAAGWTFAELPQGYGLLPVTRQLFDKLGHAQARPFSDTFRHLSAGLEALAQQVSHSGGIAYLEAEMFGGIGTQAVVVWRGDQIVLGPETTEFRTGTPPRPPSAQWAFNHGLRELGVNKSNASDEFDAVHLGRHRHTEDWLSAA
jgi:hypothetical protein